MLMLLIIQNAFTIEDKHYPTINNELDLHETTSEEYNIALKVLKK